MLDSAPRRVARSLGLAVVLSLGSALALAALASLAHADAPDPRNCTAGDVMVAAPSGGFTYSVTLRDAANQPLSGGTAILDFNPAPGLLLCDDQDPDHDRRLVGTSGATGIVTFVVRAGGSGAGTANVIVASFVIATVSVRTMDFDGDMDVDTADRAALAALLGTSGPAGDYDDDGAVTAADQGIFEQRFGGNCAQLDAHVTTWDQRWRYSFSFTADSILGSGISFSSYLFFAYNVKNWDYIKNNLGNALKIYDLFISYPISKYGKLWFGRHLNPKISNVGSIDGIQYQNQFGKYYFGAVAGSHPGFSDYGYDIKMFEFGGYLGRIDTIGNSQMENTFAFMNQTNNFKTDRRYIYFQHSNNLITNANLFASSEVDLYKVDNGVEKGSFDLTSLFLNLYYTPSRLISFSLSFDARKNAVYYETYKTYLEQILSNELRKGYRAGIYLRPLDNISIGLNGGYSFRNNDPKPARNFGANFYYYEIPLISLSANFSYSKLISSYTNGTISGIRFSKYLTSIDLNLAVDYKHIQYEFENGIEPMIQNIGSAEISFKLPLNIYLGLNYEGVFEKQNSWGRVFIDLTKRF